MAWHSIILEDDLTTHEGAADPHAAAGYVQDVDVLGSAPKVVGADSATGSAVMPTGTTAQRTGTPSAGFTRFNSDLTQLEWYDGSGWVQNLPPIISDTEENIVALTATAGQIAIATDLDQLMIADGTSWHILSAYLDVDPTTPDMGYTQGSNLAGYGRDYITDKTISNSKIGSFPTAEGDEGAIRLYEGAIQVYLDGAWGDAVTGFRFQETAVGNYALEHKPVGFNEWVRVFTGNSVSVGLNGNPIIHDYCVDMGAYPVASILKGGTF